MISKLKSCGICGMDGYIVDVEVDISNGMPAFDIVGLPDTAVKESKERIRSAIKNCNYNFPSKRITVNLAPANIKKEGVVFDLPIALGILMATEQLKPINDYMFLGELSLNGEIRKVSGVLPMVITARDNGIHNIMLPFENRSEGAVTDGVNVYGITNLYEAVTHLTGEKPIERAEVNVSKIFEENSFTNLDFADVKGQENVKRAIEIAAAGGHNLIFIGPPGSGKTMLAQRIPSILPDLSLEEALEVTKVYSIAGLMPSDTSLITTRPFRSPHHTISAVGLTGGGTVPKPGEISLSHNGVLFLDELPEFPKNVLEVLRQPLEDGRVNVSRVNGTYTFPCNAMFVASMNPCKCGYYGDSTHNCTCTSTQIQNYLGKISGPLLDRIDIHIEVSPVNYKDLEKTEGGEHSDIIKDRVNRARKIQLERFIGDNIYSNSQMTEAHLKKYCILDESANNLLKSAFDKLGLSARAYSRILKVARTIADLEDSQDINVVHIAEAIQYRALDRKYWA